MLITAREVAEILGVNVQTVYNLASSGKLTRHAPSHARKAFDQNEIEARSLARLRRRPGLRHLYWVGVAEAARELGVTHTTIRNMMLSERLPSVSAPDGRSYLRRHQFEVIANARKRRPGDLPNGAS